MGHTCESSTCESGTWTTRWPTCNANGCMLTTLTMPDGAAVSPNCGSGGDVSSGTKCTFTKNFSTCTSTECTNGAWSTTTPVCFAAPPPAPTCQFSDLRFDDMPGSIEDYTVQYIVPTARL